jgi:hypothetical protein
MSKEPNIKNSSEDEVLERILFLIGDKHGGALELLRAIDVKAKNVVTEWKAGRSKSYMKYIPKIAAFYGVSADWLLTGKSFVSPDAQKNNPGTTNGTEVDELVSLFNQMPESNRSKFLELGRTFVDEESKNKGI